MKRKMIVAVVLVSLILVPLLVREVYSHRRFACATECEDGDPLYWTCPPWALYSTCYCSTVRNSALNYEYFDMAGNFQVGRYECD